MKKSDRSKKIYIVSMLGVSNAGGVEKVSWYLQELLKEKYDVRIMQRGRLSLGKLNNLIQPMLLSLRLCFIRNKLVIGNSWHCFLYPADISIHHGTSAGIIKNTGEGGMALKLTAWMEKVSARKAKRVLAVSENCKKELVEIYGIPAEKITVLNNFVQDDFFTPEMVEKVPATQDKNQINVCFSGALCYKKGIDKLLEFSDYIEKNPGLGIKLNIATNYQRNAEPFLGRNYTSVQTGLTSSQMPDFYHQNDIMFFPTRYEGFSMAALEALSCGLPLMGSRFAVGPELESLDFCQLISEETSPEELVKIIKTLYQKYSSEGEKAKIHQTIKENFGTEQYKSKLYTLLSCL